MRVTSSAEARSRPVRLPTWLNVGLAVAVVAALLVTPLLATPSTNFNLTMVFVFVVVGAGLNLLTGGLGQISLGHGAFFALGAYSTALILEHGLMHFVLAAPLVGAGCFVVGYLFAFPVLRLAGLQLALATLGLAIITPSAIRRFDHLTQGQEGLIVLTPPVPGNLGLAQDQWIYYVCLGFAAVAYFVGSRLTANMFGRSMTGIRDNEVAAATLGVDTAKVKTMVFGVSAGFAGVGGALYAVVVGFIAPESFGLSLAITFLVLVVVGGMGTQVGVVLGAVFVQFIPTLTAGTGQGVSSLAYGVTLIVCIALLPAGLVGLGRQVLHSLRGRGRDGTKFSRRTHRRLPVQVARARVPTEESQDD